MATLILTQDHKTVTRALSLKEQSIDVSSIRLEIDKYNKQYRVLSELYVNMYDSLNNKEKMGISARLSVIRDKLEPHFNLWGH